MNNQLIASKSFYLKHKFFLIFSLIAAVVCTAIQTYCIYQYYETDVFLYTANATLPLILNILLIAVTVILLTSVFVLKNELFPPELTPIKNVSIFTCALCGCAFIITFVTGLYDIIINRLQPGSLYSTMNLFAVIFSAPAAAYFIILAVKPKPDKKITPILGFGVVIWSIFKLMSIYFAMDTPLNDPVRILHQMAVIAIMLYTLYDIGYMADIKKPVLYYLFAYLAVFIIPVSAVANIIVYTAQLKLIPISVMTSFLEFSIFLFIVSRMLSIKKSKKGVE